MYYKPTLFRADVREIAYGLIIRTIRYLKHKNTIPSTILIPNLTLMPIACSLVPTLPPQISISRWSGVESLETRVLIAHFYSLQNRDLASYNYSKHKSTSLRDLLCILHQ